jgi:hypothetical protein
MPKKYQHKTVGSASAAEQVNEKEKTNRKNNPAQ